MSFAEIIQLMPQMTGTEIRTIHVYASQLLGIDIPRQDVAVLKMVRCEHCHGKSRENQRRSPREGKMNKGNIIYN
jgi:hypothetical protein